MPEPTTPNRGYQLPHQENDLASDVYRIIAAITQIDVEVATMMVSIAAKAALAHGHAVADVAGLQAALDAKSGTSHSHAIDDLSDVSGVAGAAIGNILAVTGGGVTAVTPEALGLAGATMERFTEVVASGPKATFTITGGYVVGSVVVIANGVTLDPSEYTASNGTSITLGTALAAGDVFDVVKFPSVTIGVPAAKTVTNAILADMPTARLKGRSSAGTGDAEDLTAAQVKTLLAIGLSDVVNLVSTLAAKSDVGHTHTAAQITNLSTAVPFTKSYVSAEQTIVSGGLVTLSHGLGEKPKLTEFRLVCQTSEEGYSVGDEIVVHMVNTTSAATRANSATLTASQILIRFSSEAECFISCHKTAGTPIQPLNSRWKLVVRAYA